MLGFSLHQRWVVTMGANLAALLLCAWFLSARAQYRFDHWTADNGLPQNSGRDIVQTRDGKLWFPTRGGLAMIDPAKVRTNAQPPPVLIEAVTVDGAQAAFTSSPDSTRTGSKRVGNARRISRMSRRATIRFK